MKLLFWNNSNTPYSASAVERKKQYPLEGDKQFPIPRLLLTLRELEEGLEAEGLGVSLTLGGPRHTSTQSFVTPVLSQFRGPHVAGCLRPTKEIMTARGLHSASLLLAP